MPIKGFSSRFTESTGKSTS